MTSKNEKKIWDAFISYASEDRETVAQPLYTILSKLGKKVWFDQTELKLGDSLRRKIDQGLNECKYGIVILSSSFFNKEYPKRELDGLAYRENTGEKVILPVWYNIHSTDISKFSPPLADRIGINWDEGISKVVYKIIEVIDPSVLPQIEPISKPNYLEKVTSITQIINLMVSCEAFLNFHRELKTQEEISIVAGFLDNLNEWSDIYSEISIKGQAEAALSLSNDLEDLKNNGWHVWVGTETNNATYSLKVTGESKRIRLKTLLIAVLDKDYNRVIRTSEGILFE